MDQLWLMEWMPIKIHCFRSYFRSIGREQIAQRWPNRSLSLSLFLSLLFFFSPFLFLFFFSRPLQLPCVSLIWPLSEKERERNQEGRPLWQRKKTTLKNGSKSLQMRPLFYCPCPVLLCPLRWWVSLPVTALTGTALESLTFHKVFCCKVDEEEKGSVEMFSLSLLFSYCKPCDRTILRHMWQLFLPHTHSEGERDARSVTRVLIRAWTIHYVKLHCTHNQNRGREERERENKFKGELNSNKMRKERNLRHLKVNFHSLSLSHGRKCFSFCKTSDDHLSTSYLACRFM